MWCSGVEALEARRLFAAFAPDVSFGEDAGIVGPARVSTVRRVPQQYFLGVNADGILAFEYSGNFVASLQRYTLNGTLDTTFTPIPLDKTTSPLYGSFPAAYDVQGRVLVTDRVQEGGFRVGRYTRTGALDTTFGAGGFTTIELPVPDGQVNSNPGIEYIRAAPDGGIYVSAEVQSGVEGDVSSFKARRWLTHLSSNGSLDTGFGDDGFVAVGGDTPQLPIGPASPIYPERPFFMEVDPQGRAVVGVRTGTGKHLVQRFELDGDLDTSFATGGTYTGTSSDSFGFQMILDSSGRPVIATTGTTLTLLRLTSAGVPDPSFGDNGVVTGLASGPTQALDGLLALSGNKLLLQLSDDTGTPLVRLNANGSLDTTFDGDGRAQYLYSQQGLTHVMAPLADGSLLANLLYTDNINTITRLDAPSPVELSRTGVLYLRGTDAADSYTVSGPPLGTTSILFNGIASTFPTPSIKLIDAELRGGNNRFDSDLAVSTTVRSGAGNDTIVTGNGRDHVNSGDGNDTITTNSGRDEIFFKAGNKDIDSGFGGGYVWTVQAAENAPIANIRVRGTGTRGNDRWNVILSNAKVDLALGGTGADVRVYADQDHRIDLSAMTGDAAVYTGKGDDSILTGTGNDTIFAYAGNDTIRTSSGNDVVTSDDELARPFLPEIDTADDLIDLGAGNDRVADGFGDNTINAGAGDDSIRTGAGNDSLFGDLGRDTIRGGAGNDTLDGGAHRDRIFGNAGNDLITGGSADDTLVGDAGRDTLIGNKGNDLFVTRDGALDLVRGGDGADRGFVDEDDDVGNVETLLDIVF